MTVHEKNRKIPTAVRSRASAAAPCGCASGEGRVLTFSCSAECSCGGACSAAGAYALEGASFAVTGGTCRCGFDDPAPWRGDSCSCGDPWPCSCVGVCTCHGADAGPGLSVSFGRLTWTIPVAWRDGRGSSASEQKRMKAVYASEWTMDGDAVVKRKHGMELTLTDGGMVFLNGGHMGKVDEDGVGE